MSVMRPVIFALPTDCACRVAQQNSKAARNIRYFVELIGTTPGSLRIASPPAKSPLPLRQAAKFVSVVHQELSVEYHSKLTRHNFELLKRRLSISEDYRCDSQK